MAAPSLRPKRLARTQDGFRFQFLIEEVAIGMLVARLRNLCLSKTPKYLSRRELYLFPNSSFDAYFSRRTARRPGFGRPFTGRTPTGELGLASANQCSSPLPQETTEIEHRRSPLLGLPVPPLARLALHVSHGETGNRRGLASQRSET